MCVLKNNCNRIGTVIESYLRLYLLLLLYFALLNFMLTVLYGEY